MQFPISTGTDLLLSVPGCNVVAVRLCLFIMFLFKYYSVIMSFRVSLVILFPLLFKLACTILAWRPHSYDFIYCRFLSIVTVSGQFGLWSWVHRFLPEHRFQTSPEVCFILRNFILCRIRLLEGCEGTDRKISPESHYLASWGLPMMQDCTPKE